MEHTFETSNDIVVRTTVTGGQTHGSLPNQWRAFCGANVEDVIDIGDNEARWEISCRKCRTTIRGLVNNAIPQTTLTFKQDRHSPTYHLCNYAKEELPGFGPWLDSSAARRQTYDNKAASHMRPCCLNTYRYMKS